MQWDASHRQEQDGTHPTRMIWPRAAAAVGAPSTRCACRPLCPAAATLLRRAWSGARVRPQLRRKGATLIRLASAQPQRLAPGTPPLRLRSRGHHRQQDTMVDQKPCPATVCAISDHSLASPIVVGDAFHTLPTTPNQSISARASTAPRTVIIPHQQPSRTAQKTVETTGWYVAVGIPNAW